VQIFHCIVLYCIAQSVRYSGWHPVDDKARSIWHQSCWLFCNCTYTVGSITHSYSVGSWQCW